MIKDITWRQLDYKATTIFGSRNFPRGILGGVRRRRSLPRRYSTALVFYSTRNFQLQRFSKSNEIAWYGWRNTHSCIFNTSHTHCIGNRPNFYLKLVSITRHAMPFYQRPGWSTEQTNSLLM